MKKNQPMKPLLQKNKIDRRIVIASAIFLALAFGLGMVLKQDELPSSAEATEGKKDVVEVPTFRHPLTGIPTSSPVSSDLQVYAVMLDNSVDAWPVSGIDQAFLVIEAPVEAEIPRLEAFFSSDEVVEKIGPVRSARPYFIDWANEFDALYTHVGGSNAALEEISSTGTFDINEFWNGDYFWRSSDRYAPHNTYTSTDLLGQFVAKAIERDRAPEVLYGTWSFKDRSVDQKNVPVIASETKQSPAVTVRFNSDLYTVDWTYNSETGTYIRSQGGREYKTADGTQISATNVAVLLTDIEILDYVGRRSIQTISKGKAWLAQDGVTQEVTWKKTSVSERLRFFDQLGNEILMNAGNTWIEVIGSESDLTIN